MNKLFIFTLLALLPLFQSATLRIIEAGVPGGLASWRIGRTLPPTVTLCATNLFPSYSIECVPDKPTTSASFFIDGTFSREESVRPYVLTGDAGGVANPWSPPSSSLTVACELPNGEKVSSQITFSCPGGGSSTTPTAPSPSPKPPKTDPVPPAVGKNGCVRIGALNYVSKKGMWTVEDGALIYKKGDPSRGIDGPSTAPVTYSFVAPVTSRYAVTLDMRTEGGVDHNDVWIEFEDGGFSLERADGSQKDSKGWTKAYHNKNGRAVLAFSVDFNPHSISTKKMLQKGVRYTIRVAGRSTKVWIYSIVMFPCSGSQCVIGSYWNNQVAMCA